MHLLPSPPGAPTPMTEAGLSLEFDGFVNPGVQESGSDPWEQRVISRALGHNLVPMWVVPTCPFLGPYPRCGGALG